MMKTKYVSIQGLNYFGLAQNAEKKIKYFLFLF